MKVLHYCRSFSPLSETFIYDVIKELQETGVSNIVLTQKIAKQEERPFPNIIKLPAEKKQYFRKAILKLLDFLKLFPYDGYIENLRLRRQAIKDVLEKEKPSIIQAHFGPRGFEILPVAEQMGIPLVVSFHGFDAFQLPQENNEWLNRLKKVFQGADAITVVSEVMKNHLVKLGCSTKKLHVIHVGKKLIDYPFIQKDCHKIYNFVSVGRLTEKKGHSDCIEAFISLIQDNPDVKLQIFGEGELENELKTMIAVNNLGSNIQLRGAVDHGLVKKQLIKADAFILCSKTAGNGDQEGIPTVLMEAQALGLPCVSTRHSGIPEVIPLENQWMLAQEGSPQSITEVVKILCEIDPVERVEATIRGRKKIEEEFNLEVEVVKLKKLYKSLMKDNNKV